MILFLDLAGVDSLLLLSVYRSSPALINFLGPTVGEVIPPDIDHRNAQCFFLKHRGLTVC